MHREDPPPRIVTRARVNRSAERAGERLARAGQILQHPQAMALIRDAGAKVVNSPPIRPERAADASKHLVGEVEVAALPDHVEGGGLSLLEEVLYRGQQRGRCRRRTGRAARGERERTVGVGGLGLLDQGRGHRRGPPEPPDEVVGQVQPGLPHAAGQPLLPLQDIHHPRQLAAGLREPPLQAIGELTSPAVFARQGAQETGVDEGVDPRSVQVAIQPLELEARRRRLAVPRQNSIQQANARGRISDQAVDPVPECLGFCQNHWLHHRNPRLGAQAAPYRLTGLQRWFDWRQSPDGGRCTQDTPSPQGMSPGVQGCFWTKCPGSFERTWRCETHMKPSRALLLVLITAASGALAGVYETRAHGGTASAALSLAGSTALAQPLTPTPVPTEGASPAFAGPVGRVREGCGGQRGCSIRGPCRSGAG